MVVAKIFWATPRHNLLAFNVCRCNKNLNKIPKTG
jgi:hypothetical protein